MADEFFKSNAALNELKIKNAMLKQDIARLRLSTGEQLGAPSVARTPPRRPMVTTTRAQVTPPSQYAPVRPTATSTVPPDAQTIREAVERAMRRSDEARNKERERRAERLAEAETRLAVRREQGRV